MKTAGFKARHGRYRTHPVPHKPHRKRVAYSRFSRILKARVREALAPQASDFDAEELAVRPGRPLSNAITLCGVVGLSPDHSQNRGRTTSGGPRTHGGTTP